MPWLSANFQDDDIWVVLSQIDAHLARLPVYTHPSVKIGTSDIRHGKARGIVVWNDEDYGSIPPPTGSDWGSYNWMTDHDYDSMFNGLVNALNQFTLPDRRVLSRQSAAYARTCMTDMHGGAASLTLFWRT